MKKQFIMAGAGVLIVAILFIFGRTTAHQKPVKNSTPEKPTGSFDIEKFILSAKQQLPPSQAYYLDSLENSVKRGDVHTQQLTTYSLIAKFWKDSARLFEPYAFWTSKAAKLDNSEKNLTFAGQLFLDNLRGEHDLPKLNWEKAEAISLFEKAIELNPDNDSLKVGLGSCYVFGAAANGGDPQETMKGIQQLLSVVRKDSNNMKAQLVLGVGGFVSGQYDKAIDRFKKVIAREPSNVEANLFLADSYAATGNKEEAIKWYTISKGLFDNADYRNQIDERIKSLKSE
ncbi:MAG: tetratricopeptide repeat protein [Bacteroidetes bacterium]|nr:tetratricopeptide repeat protein [Bacteroidota bacterium]